MTDVTAQAFREAAATLGLASPFTQNLNRLLIAAAEQREQLDAVYRSLETPLPPEDEEELDRMARLLREKDQQIATLSADRDQARTGHADYVAQAARAHAHLRDASLTYLAERDEARQERDAIFAKLDRRS